MMNFILGWLLGKNIIENDNQRQHMNNYEPTITLPEKKDIIIYEYWPAFDNDVPSLEIAYKLYEENQVCHVIKDGVCKCYFEFTGDENYLKKEPRKFYDRI